MLERDRLLQVEEEEPPSRFDVLILSVGFVFLGITSFLLSNGQWAELPIYFREAPEGARVAVYLILALQAANIWPLFYVLRTKQKEERLTTLIWIILAGGFIVSLLLARFHGSVIQFLGLRSSLPLFLLAFSSASCSAMSNVTYFPLVGRYPRKFTTALVLGESLSGFVAGIGGIFQKSGEDVQRFSPTAYFLGCALFFVLGMLGFAVILSKKQFVNSSHSYTSGKDDESRGGAVLAMEWNSWPVLSLLTQQSLIGALAYGFLPSISTIMVQGYAHQARVLQWAVILGMIADPIARSLTYVCQSHRFWILTPSTLGFAAICITCALMAPMPLFYDQAWGGAIPILAYSLFQFLTGFTLTMALFHLRKVVGDAQTETAYRWSGFAVQFGAMTGSFIAFYLVIVLQVFAV